VKAGRLVAILISLVVLLGGGYASFRLSMDRREHKGREAVLRRNLAMMRTAIKTFHDDQGRYPRSLDELVPRYVRSIPRDPMTNERDWRVDTEQVVLPSGDFTTNSTVTESYVVDVHSAGRAPYSSW